MKIAWIMQLFFTVNLVFESHEIKSWFKNYSIQSRAGAAGTKEAKKHEQERQQSKDTTTTITIQN